MSEHIKRGIRNWLDIDQNSYSSIHIRRTKDFEQHAIQNRLWYIGDENELEQLYQQDPQYADQYKFWASKCTPGMEMRKIHTGLPGLIVRTLTSIVLSDMNDFDFTDNEESRKLWEDIAEENKFNKTLEGALKETLFIGDGAFKISVDTQTTPLPIIEWFPGERIELVYVRGKIKEIIFKSEYVEDHKRYTLNERYGYGYIINELYQNEELVPMERVRALAGLKDTKFDKSIMLAVPLKVYDSAKFAGRGGSIYDGKIGSFDALDEAWSQWMDMLRAARVRTYIPESYIPRNPQTGELLKPNPFDNRFIVGDTDMSEGARNLIATEQPTVAHDGYASTYCTALDLCLQGIISPSTLGIDVKKLDNAEAQREKEKATLYTRNAIIEALQETLPQLVHAAVNTIKLMNKRAIKEVKVEIPFGEYANPSFESQVETLSKARPGVAVMSIEAQVEEMWGDSKDEDWKKEEVARLKAEQGIAEVEEPGVNRAAGPFNVNLKEGQANAGGGNGSQLSNEPGKVSGTS